jgi:N-acetylmuramate 1-kinase
MAAKRNADDATVEGLDLADEAATVILARWVAGFARAGDFIGLSGDLGAGKTAFARAFLRAVTGDSELEAPSPTFTLVQTYEGPEFPIVHADFHRLRGADELTQLGWDETTEGAVALVEWPQLAAAALPADRLEIALSFDPEHGSGFRRVEFFARGAMAARFKLARAIESLLAGVGWADARRELLHGDASTRAFERLTSRDGQTAILMISPPRAGGPTLRFGKTYPEIAKLSADIRAFVALAEGLRSLGFSTPRIYALSLADGLALLEDFGADTIAEAGVPNAPRYAEATSLISDLHRRELPTELPAESGTYVVPTYDIEAMLIEVELALDWYAPAIARGNPSSGARMQFLALWRDILAPVLAQPTTWTLRDFHSPNLHWLPERYGLRRLGLIDFQDAVLGPPAYDVASLLQDARVAVPEDLELRLLAHYARRRASADPSFNATAFTAAYSIMGAQRATKILGIFTRLDRRDGKPQYLDHLPRIERTLAKNLKHPSLEPLRQWFETHLPRALGSSVQPAETI